MASERPPFPVDPEAIEILEALWSAGHGAYLVGGGVRDRLLGLPTTDWDVTTDARPERIVALFPGATYENRFGTVQVRGVEITTFRRDHRYADHRRPERVTFSDDVYEDLARRDFTINAIAWGRRSLDVPARLIDPADGQGDLEARIVRAVGDPALRFDEDALRLLRAVRIAARLDFTIEPLTLAAMTTHAPDVDWVSGERVGSEIRRMLHSQRPSRAFELMLRTGILDHVLPELRSLAHQPSGPAGRDGLELGLAALDRVTQEALGEERPALAALISQADTVGARRTLERLFLSQRDIEVIESLRVAAVAAYERSWRDADVRRFLASLPADLRGTVMLLRGCLADVIDGDAGGDEADLQARIRAQLESRPPLALADLAVDGTDLRERLGLPEGPRIGQLLARLLDDVIEDPARNEPATLLARAGSTLGEPTGQGAAGTSPPPSARLEA